MTDNEYKDYLLSCGFDIKEVKQKIKERDILRKLYYKEQREPRPITSASFERALKRTNKQVFDFIGGIK